MDQRRRAPGIRTRASWLVALAVCLGQVASLLAFRARVPAIHVAANEVRASVELTEAFSDQLRARLENGASLYLRVQTALWEDHAVWDRQVQPAAVAVFRVVRNPANGEVAVIDAAGHLAAYPTYPDPLVVEAAVAPESAIDPGGRYYVDTTTTFGTVNERDLEEAGKAMFGDDGGVGLGRLGRFLLSSVLEVTDYMQGASAKAKSPTYDGRQLRGS